MVGSDKKGPRFDAVGATEWGRKARKVEARARKGAARNAWKAEAKAAAAKD